MAARVGVSKPIAGSVRGRRRVAAQQTNRGTLSVKELSEELDRARQNEVSMRNKLRAVSPANVYPPTLATLLLLLSWFHVDLHVKEYGQ